MTRLKTVAAAICATAALVLPAAPASASDVPSPVGTKTCPAPYVGGFILWIDTKATGYHEEWFCIPGTPGAATQSESDASSARAGVTRCGAAGHYIVWYYDLNNEYQEVWNSCI